MNTLLLNTTTYKTYSEAILNSLDTISLGIKCENKCVFNYKSNIYELRSILNNKINWYEKPMYISDSVEKQFNESYDKFILSLLNTNKNNNNNNNHNNRYTNSRYVQNNSVYNTNT